MVLGIALAKPWGTFAELAVEHPEHGDTALTFHHGYTCLLRPGFQLDAHAGVGLSDAAADWFVAAGWAARF